eukprot:COSAG02_NODE_39723_length_413_cov_1.449045_1_plen_134_part_10
MMDLDVSDRVIFEDNLISMTEPGIPPHGNSISGCKYATTVGAAPSIALADVSYGSKREQEGASEPHTFIIQPRVIVVPRNYVSADNYGAHPSSRFWSVSRNTLTRPPSSYADKQIWTQRETLTTDGSGWWASGH